ncbi:MAG: hypothetical protein K2J58_07470 [Muribaculaceae bacterium]|nr:hypothetical protein [Muribaculaceae bacterium]
MKKLFNWRSLSMGALAVGFMTLAVGSVDPIEPAEPGTPGTPGTDVPVEDLSAMLKEIQEKYFGIMDAEFLKGSFPAGDAVLDLSGITVNNKALTGGMNYITATTKEQYTEFYVGIEGVDGYYFKFTPNPDSVTFDPATGEYLYTVPMLFGVDFKINITIKISVKLADGEITEPIIKEIQHVESLSGDLHVNLVFNNEKDIDLHLITPNGTRIYYGNRGGSITLEDGSVIEYGLDHDSNAACNIDGLNNENIVIPDALIEPGVYSVYVNMYSNCDPNIATSWSLVTRYNDQLITPLTGSNPESGVYPAHALNGDMTEVMTFEITPAQAARIKSNRKSVEGTFVPRQLSDVDMWKLEMSEGLDF